jgi:hypothetical protein
MKSASQSIVFNSACLKALVLTAMIMLPAAAQSGGIAMITDLQGKATMSAEGRARDVTILAEVDAGTQVQLAAGATLVVLYLDAGEEYVLKGPATIVFKSTQPDVTSGARPEKRGSSLGKGGPAIKIKPVGVAQGAMVMRGFRTGARIQLLNLHKTRTLETRPEFYWQALQPGVKYHIEVTDETGRMLHEADIDSASYKLPGAVTLKDGVPYTWEVSARLPDGRKYSSSADFAIAPEELRKQADALRPAPAAPLSTRVAYAAWLEQMELKDEARKYWKTASSERPDDPRLKALAEQ